MVVGTCEVCSKRFKVPDTGKKYRCPACKEGVVQVESEPAATAPQPPPPPARESMGEGQQRRSFGMDPERSSARRKIVRIRKILGAVRTLNIVSALLTCLALTLLFLVSTEIEVQAHVMGVDASEVKSAMMLFSAILVASLVVDILGAIFVLSQPVLWTTLFAAAHTLALAAAAIQVSVPSLVIQGILALFGWGAFRSALRLRPIFAEFPDLNFQETAPQRSSAHRRPRRNRRR